MEYDPGRHHRRSIRLADFDYSQEGVYFVTICTHERECLFGEIHEGEMQLNDIGLAVHNEWLKSAGIRREIHLDMFVVMPNHIHGIVFIIQDIPTLVGATGGRPPICERHRRPFVPKKWATAGRPYRRLVHAEVHLQHSSVDSNPHAHRSSMNFGLTGGHSLWQRNYYEHIIRNEKSLNAVRGYIQANPLRWADDPDNPNFIGKEGSSAP